MTYQIKPFVVLRKGVINTLEVSFIIKIHGGET